MEKENNVVDVAGLSVADLLSYEVDTNPALVHAYDAIVKQLSSSAGIALFQS